jgi:hypothetical protein
LRAPLKHHPWLLDGAELPSGTPTEHLLTIGPFAPSPQQA